MTSPTAKRPRSNGAWRIFRWPLLIAVITVAGLISALVGDGIYDAASWLMLGGVILLIAVRLAVRK
jgi:uncharacterized membrane protein YjjP (DUF1212 family)